MRLWMVSFKVKIKATWNRICCEMQHVSEDGLEIANKGINEAFVNI